MRKKLCKKLLPIVAAVILLILMICGGLRIMESAVISNEQQNGNITKTIIKDGVAYFPRQDICAIMILGIDATGPVVASEEPNHGNAVDMVTLLIFDEKDKTLSLLSLNRDTMVEMPRLNEYGKETGTRVAQLALSHAYGHGVEDSCTNTKKTVERLLPGLSVDYYYAMNMDAVGILNDAVGGVKVIVEDDFSAVDPSISQGEITLSGNQAITFVQSRRLVGNQLNASRIIRQQQYMESFVSALREKMNQGGRFIAQTYEAVSDYVVTDLTTAALMRLADDYRDYQIKNVITLEGENVRGEEHYEFYVDENALEELTLELFYEVKQ